MPPSRSSVARRLLTAACAALLIATAAHAQDFTAPVTPSGAPAAQEAPAQTSGGIRGQVADPSGAVIPDATVVVLDTAGKTAGKAISDSGGAYAVHGLPAGTYSVWVTAPGFASYRVPNVVVAAGQMKTVNPAMQIQVQQQQVEVQSENTTIGTAADENASAIVIKGTDLNALSDDPDELQNELQALAGPSAGPNGGQIYIDGFTGGQLPPKSSIREIRVNQNPFSAEYDRLGYGRIEIFTKPGTDKLHGQAELMGNDSHFNSQNPILQSKTEPPYYSWFLHGNVGGPISKNMSYFFSIFSRQQQNEAILEAIDPASVQLKPNSKGVLVASGTPINEAINNPSARLNLSPRLDVQLGKANTLTLRYEYNRFANTNGGLNPLSLPSTAIDVNQQENTLQASDSLILSPKLVDDIRFQYRRVRNNQNAVGGQLPSYTVQGAFTDGASNSQTVQDHENDFELQNYLSGAFGAHSLNFGARLRSYGDVNLTTSGSNGSYAFASLGDFLGCVQPSQGTCNPQQYTYNYIATPANAVARAILFDAGLFYQDDWKVNSRFTFSYGLRWETQNRIHDKSDWAPRVAFAYALGRSSGKQQPKTVLRAGYGWFYQRFTVPNGFGAQIPFIMTAIHQNGINEQTFIQNSQNGPIPFDPTKPTPITSPTTSGSGGGRAAPTHYTLDPNMKVANDMEAAVGVDRQLSKFMTGNVTYVFSQGIHQYFTDNLSAAGVFPLADAKAGVYPASVSEPPTNDLQYQSGGFYKEHQVMVTFRAQFRTFSFMTNYTFSHALGDTSGIGSVPSVSSFPGLDYGRTTFDVTNRLFLLGNFFLPWKVTAAPMVVFNSGTPFNITTGSDLTGNNQFNARPTYGDPALCNGTSNGYINAPGFGCLNTNPYGTSERIMPYGVGTGPSTISINMRLNKAIGVGPKLGEGQYAAGGGGHMHGGPGGLGGGGFSGSRGGPGRMDASVNRRYTLNLGVWATNILNHENLGTPNGVLTAGPAQGPGEVGSFFNQSQSLAGGFFGSQTGGNRSIFLNASFSF
ncbi:MAG: carboxypeptidase regulatory-like domain-containing protein [Acidobacteriota bacterium]